MFRDKSDNNTADFQKVQKNTNLCVPERENTNVENVSDVGEREKCFFYCS